MARRFVLLAATLLVAGTASAAAPAAPADDARAAADRFLAAAAAEDANTACSMLTARVLTKLGGQEKCASSLKDDSASTSGSDVVIVSVG